MLAKFCEVLLAGKSFKLMAMFPYHHTGKLCSLTGSPLIAARNLRHCHFKAGICLSVRLCRMTMDLSFCCIRRSYMTNSTSWIGVRQLLSLFFWTTNKMKSSTSNSHLACIRHEARPSSRINNSIILRKHICVLTDLRKTEVLECFLPWRKLALLPSHYYFQYNILDSNFFIY